MIARAKKIDSDELVSGYYAKVPHLEASKIIHQIEVFTIDTEVGLDSYCYDIDPSTLQYKIGDRWYSEETLKSMVVFAEEEETRAKRIFG